MAGRKKRERERLKKIEHRNRWISVCYAGLTFVYLELVFNRSTIRTAHGLSLLYTVLFSLAYGIGMFWLTSLCPKESVNRLFRKTVYILLSVLFTVNYFVFRTFKVFYDVRTVLAGSTRAMEGFHDQILRMTTSPSGLFHILLFFLPAIFYSYVISRLDQGTKRTLQERFLYASFAILFFVGAVLTLSYDGTMYGVYTNEYSFQTAVTDFGLISAIRMDVERNRPQGSGTTSFETVTVEEQKPEETEVIEEAVYERYGRNELDLDFSALMETGTALSRQLDEYVQSQTPSSQNRYTGYFAGKNLIFISAEAFSAEVIDPIRTPTLYRLATKGFNFTDYYQPASAGTTGGEYENLFGLLPSEGGSSFKLTSRFHNVMTMGYQLNELGYEGWAFHNNDYTFYDRHITHNNLGYSHGFMGVGNGLESYITDQWPQSDLELMEATLDWYIEEEPFNVYYMSVSGHNMYNSSNAMGRKHWDQVSDLPGYTDDVKYYLAANLELEDAMTYLVGRLEEKGIADDTVIVIAADHFPYGLDYGEALAESDNLANLYGYQPMTNLERDHNRLIIWSGCLEDEEPVIIDTPTSSLDILPTLLNLFGVEWDSRLLPGRDVFSDRKPLVFTLNYDWKTTMGTYHAASGTFTPKEGVSVSDSYVESMRAEVRNKVNYCKGVLSMDYFWHVLGESEQD